MSPKPHSAASEPGHGYALSEKTSQTDDQRIRDVTPLPPPEHLIRFFPIAGTPVESLIGGTRESIRRILNGQDDRLLVVMGPCSIHDPLAALEYTRITTSSVSAWRALSALSLRAYSRAASGS